MLFFMIGTAVAVSGAAAAAASAVSLCCGEMPLMPPLWLLFSEEGRAQIRALNACASQIQKLGVCIFGSSANACTPLLTADWKRGSGELDDWQFLGVTGRCYRFNSDAPTDSCLMP